MAILLTRPKKNKDILGLFLLLGNTFNHGMHKQLYTL